MQKLILLLDVETRSKSKFLEKFSLGMIMAQSKKIKKGKKVYNLTKKIKPLDPVIESLSR